LENLVSLSVQIFPNTQPFGIGKGFPQTLSIREVECTRC